jgi:hypothetical protein
LPRHEADLSTEETAKEPYARLPEAIEVSGRPERPEAPPGEGPQAPRGFGAEEVMG